MILKLQNRFIYTWINQKIQNDIDIDIVEDVDEWWVGIGGMKGIQIHN